VRGLHRSRTLGARACAAGAGLPWPPAPLAARPRNGHPSRACGRRRWVRCPGSSPRRGARIRSRVRSRAPAGPASVLAASVVEAGEALPVGRWDARPVVGHHQHRPGTLSARTDTRPGWWRGAARCRAGPGRRGRAPWRRRAGGALKLRDEVKVDFDATPRRAVDGAPASCLPVFKVCIGSSEPFVGVLNWAPLAQPLAADRRDRSVAVVVAVGRTPQGGRAAAQPPAV